MEKILYFDYCSFFILAILLISTIFRGMTKGRPNKAYIELLIVSMLATIFDILAVFLDNHGAGNVMLKYITHSGYLILHNLTPPFYIIYLMLLSDTDHKMKRNKIIPFSVPISIVLILLLSNPWHKKLFYMDAADCYTRGPLFPALYLCAAFYVIWGLVHLIRYRQSYGRGRFFSLFGMYPIMIAATVAQMLMPQILFEMLANALGMLLISTMIQRAEDFIDTETGLGKKSAYATDIDRAMVNGKSYALIMINLTNYTALSNMLGYTALLDLLRKVSHVFTDLNAEHNFGAAIYYIGDGKFRFILDYRHLSMAEQAAEVINGAMKTDVLVNGMEVNLVAMICVVRCPEDVSDIESLMELGSELDAKKYSGEVLYASNVYQKNHYDLMRDLDSIIENALATQGFEVYYQPIYSVEEHRFHSAEALLRLKDDEYGFISPELFIPVAEKSGAIHRIGTYVLEEVCRFIASDEYRALQMDYIEINLSVTQCMRPNLAQEVLEIMNRYGVKPDQINLEITETAASYSQNTMMENIETLTDAGISFSLDDYGTGYSNMRRIASMPFSIVKLDKSFINADRNPRIEIILENTIHMIKDMNMKIVVEGIETAELVQQFSDLKCEYIQGYYFSKPIPKEEFVSFIQNS